MHFLYNSVHAGSLGLKAVEICSAAILFKLADSIPAEQLAKDLSAGQLNDAIEALSNLELSETADALGRIRKDLENEGNYESAAGG
jgi:hypothetical protein